MLSRSSPPGGSGSRSKSRRTPASRGEFNHSRGRIGKSPRSGLGPEHHLRAAEEGDAPGRRGYYGVPYLGGPAQVQGARPALDDPFTCGAEEIRLQLDGREASRALRQERHATVAAARIRQGDHCGGVQEAVRRHDLAPHRQPAVHQPRLHRNDLHADEPGQVPGAEGLEEPAIPGSHGGLL